MDIRSLPDPKYGLDIFLHYFPLFSSTTHLPGLVPTPKASASCPLSIGMPSLPGWLKMEKLKKKEKLKNRHLIQNPFIIWDFLNFNKLQPGIGHQKKTIFCILKSRFAIPCQMRAVPGPGLKVLSEFQEERYFWRKSRYTRSVLVEGRGVDQGADDGRVIDI